MAKLDPAAWDRIRAGLLPAYVDVPAFTARVVGALDEVVAAHEGRATAVVVAHAGVINTWLAHSSASPGRSCSRWTTRASPGCSRAVTDGVPSVR
jgi:broad specificity phosphatase PhoE